MAEGPEVNEIRDTVVTQVVEGGYVTAVPIIIPVSYTHLTLPTILLV